MVVTSLRRWLLMLATKKYVADIFLHVGDITIDHQHHVMVFISIQLKPTSPIFPRKILNPVNHPNHDDYNLLFIFWNTTGTTTESILWQINFIIVDIFFGCLSFWSTFLTSLCWTFKPFSWKFFIIYIVIRMPWKVTAYKR